MLDFTYYSPTKLIFGKGRENNIGENLAQYGAKRIILFYYGTGLDFENSLIGRVKSSLDGAGIEYIEVKGIKPNPTIQIAREAARIAVEKGVDFMLAVGGGSVIDTAKFASVQARYDGDLWADCFSRRIPMPKEGIPVATILTLAGTGSEASEACLIKDEDTGRKDGIDADAMRPVFSILNPELTCSVPAYQTACGVADILCHLHESYFTRIDDGMLMNEYIEGLMRTVIKFGRLVMKEPENYLARAQIMLAGTMANWHLTWCGRGDDGAVHFMQGPVSEIYDSAHGHGCAVLTLGWLRFVYKTDIARFYRYYTRVWNVPADELHAEDVILEGIAKQREFYRELGLDTSKESVGIREEDIEMLAASAGKRPNGKTGMFVQLGTEDIVEIYNLCD